MDSQTISLISVPLFTGAIGYVTNWTGVWMLFYPVRFAGFRLPGLAPLSHLLPRRIQQIPGVMQGGVGWQGIIPSRAAKMGSIAVDKGIAKVGSPREFFDQLDRRKLSEQILDASREDAQFWRDLPPQMRARVERRVQEQLPDVVDDVTDQLADRIDELVDVKLM